MIILKFCTICKEGKILDEFYNNKSSADGKHPHCKECRKKDDRLRYLRKSDYICKQQRARYAKNAEKERESAKARYQKRMSIPEERRKILDLKSKWQRERSASDVGFRINRAFSREISRMVNKRGEKWLDSVNYSIKELMAHLESQFYKGMAWDNYGKYWHIDHIMPKSMFQVERLGDDEFIACWSLSNLRPLLAVDNLKKHSKIVFLL